MSDDADLASFGSWWRHLLFAVSPLFTQGFNGFEPDQFPVPQDDPPVQPAGYAFSIWGLNLCFG